jgi:hypothetical protein
MGAVPVGVPVAVGPGEPVRVAVGLVRVAVGLVRVAVGWPGTTPPVRVPVAVGLTQVAPAVPVALVAPGAGAPGVPVRVPVVPRGLVRVAVGEPVVAPGDPVGATPVGGAISLGSCGTSVGCATADDVLPVARPAVAKIPATTAAGTMSAAARPRLVRPRVRCSGIVIPPRVVKGPQASTPNS